jgi:polyisoprenoid-binding protein YceI
MTAFRFIVLCLAGAGLLSTAAARSDVLSEVAGTYDIQRSSRIGFTVSQVGGGGIKGQFEQFSGVFRLNPTDVSRSEVEFTLYPESVRTGQGRVENFLRSDAVFDVGRFPQVSFRSTGVAQLSATVARIDGTLTARGRSRPASFIAELQDRGRNSIAFHVVGDIYRSPYGMDVGTPIYSNVVHFDMLLRGQRH